MTLEQAMQYIGVFLVCSTALGKFLNGVIPWLRTIALSTVTAADDQGVRLLERFAEALAHVNDWIPHILVGTPNQSARPSRPPSSATGSLKSGPFGLVFVLVAASSVSACGTDWDAVDSAIDIAGAATSGLEAVYEPRAAELRAHCEGQPEGMHLMCMREAISVARGVQEARAAVAVARSLAASIEAGTADGARCDVLRPLVHVLEELASVVHRAGVVLPPALGTVLAGASGICAEDDDAID